MSVMQTAAPLAPPRPLAVDSTALFLDLDGTVAAIEARPQGVGPEPWRTKLLARLQARLGGRLAIVSGRSLSEVDRIVEGTVTCVSAVHGLVRRHPDGTVETCDAAPGLRQAVAALHALAAKDDGLEVEDKLVSATLHYRRAPAMAVAVIDAARALAAAHGLKLQLGDMVAELCTPGRDKGWAVRAFMAEAPFAGAAPLFVGDDLTDEAGFAAAAALGGRGVLVGPPRHTAAENRLESVRDVRAWLEQGLSE